MDADRFTDKALGSLEKVALTEELHDWAFIPRPLPRDYELPGRLLHLLGDAREKLGELNGIGQTLANPTLLLRPLQQREAIRSSSLEGTDVLPAELLRYQLDPKQPQSERDRRNAWREVTNHNEALVHGCRALEELPLCTRLIKQLHERLLSNVRGQDKQPGRVRRSQVHVGSDRRFIPPPPGQIDHLMQDLEEFLNEDLSRLNPLVRAYMAHYQFEAIHPFLDGNGRIGRVLLSLCVYLWHEHQMPWLYMSAYFDRYKDEYIDNLFRVSTHGDWSRWIEFCLRGTVRQCEDAIRRCRMLRNLRTDYHERADDVSPRAYQILDKTFELPVFRIRDVMEWCGVSRPTAQKDVNALMDAGVASRLEGQRPRTYYMPTILELAYADTPLVGPDSGVGARD